MVVLCGCCWKFLLINIWVGVCRDCDSVGCVLCVGFVCLNGWLCVVMRWIFWVLGCSVCRFCWWLVGCYWLWWWFWFCGVWFIGWCWLVVGNWWWVVCWVGWLLLWGGFFGFWLCWFLVVGFLVVGCVVIGDVFMVVFNWFDVWWSIWVNRIYFVVVSV